MPLYSLYALELVGFDGAVLYSGLIIALVGIAAILTSTYWGIAGQKFGFAPIMTLCMVASGVLLSLQFMTNTILQFSILQFIFALMLAGAIPLISTMMVQNTNVNFRGRAFGLSNSASMTGNMIGPLLGGILSAWLSIPTVFLIDGIILILIGLSVWYLFRKNKVLKKQEETN